MLPITCLLSYTSSTNKTSSSSCDIIFLSFMFHFRLHHLFLVRSISLLPIALVFVCHPPFVTAVSMGCYFISINHNVGAPNKLNLLSAVRSTEQKSAISPHGQTALVGLVKVSTSHTDTQCTLGLRVTTDRPVAEDNLNQQTTAEHPRAATGIGEGHQVDQR